MGEPYRYRKRLINIGKSKYVLIPTDWKLRDSAEVILEVYDDKIVITPVLKKAK